MKIHVLFMFLGSVLAIIVAGVVVGLVLPPRITWVGPAFRTLRFRVVDADSGKPVVGAHVSLVNTIDPQDTAIQSVTNETGVADIRGQLKQFGGNSNPSKKDVVTYVTYDSLSVRVVRNGYYPYCAFLGNMGLAGENDVDCHSYLNLPDPAPVPILLKIKATDSTDLVAVEAQLDVSAPTQPPSSLSVAEQIRWWKTYQVKYEKLQEDRLKILKQLEKPFQEFDKVGSANHETNKRNFDNVPNDKNIERKYKDALLPFSEEARKLKENFVRARSELLQIERYQDEVAIALEAAQQQLIIQSATTPTPEPPK